MKAFNLLNNGKQKAFDLLNNGRQAAMKGMGNNASFPDPKTTDVSVGPIQNATKSNATAPKSGGGFKKLIKQ